MGVDAGKAAETLMRDHAGGATFQPFAADLGIATAEDAYAVQREYVRLLAKSRGTKAAGYKIELTTPRMQAMCGIDSPVAGVILKIACTPPARTSAPPLMAVSALNLRSPCEWGGTSSQSDSRQALRTWPRP